MASLVSVNNGYKPEIIRPIANFDPDIWGQQFLTYSPENEEIYLKKKQEHELLKNEMRRELLETTEKPFEYLKLVDLLERLGVAYHFGSVIEETLRQIYDSNKEIAQKEDDLDLYHTSLKFRILRQHRYHIPSNVFERFIDEQGNFLESLKEDVKSILCLYEASHLKMHGEDILERALEFTKTHLMVIVEQLNHPLVAQIARALKYPSQKAVIPLESRHYITFYEQDPYHSKGLLRFVKLDFDLRQSLYKEELKELTNWKNSFDFSKKFPFVRERLVEAHFFSVATYFQPQFSIARKIYTKAFVIVTILDDIYDAFGIIEELKALTEAIERWDKGYTDQLPNYMKEYYEILYDTFEKFEDELAKSGRKNYVNYARCEVIALSRAYLQEAKWRESEYVPTYEEYVENALKSSGTSFVATISFLDNEVEESIARKGFEIVSTCGKPQRVGCIIGRFMNDLVDYEWDRQRKHVVGVVDCYMKQYSVSKEEACKAINVVLENAWKDLAEEIVLPTTPTPMPLLTRIHNFCRVCYYIYRYEDAFTLATERMRSTLALLFVEPVF